MRICCEKTVNSGTATDVVATSEGFIVRKQKPEEMYREQYGKYAN